METTIIAEPNVDEITVAVTEEQSQEIENVLANFTYIEHNQSSPTGRADTIRDIMAFCQAHGVSEADAQKLPALFEGPHALCALRSRKVHVAAVNKMAEELFLDIDRLTGGLTAEIGGVSTAIALRSDCAQNLFLVAYERVSPPTKPEPGKAPEIKRFWTFALICAEVKGNVPMSLALDLNIGGREGNTYFMRFSRSIYYPTRTMPDGSTVTENRLRHLGGNTNIEANLANIAVFAQFPLEGARPFPTRDRMSGNARRQGQFNQQAPQGQAETPAGGDTNFSDPFADS